MFVNFSTMKVYCFSEKEIRSAFLRTDIEKMDFPGSASGKEPACQCRRHKRLGFDPWVGKIPWRRARQSTPVSLPGDPMDRGAWWATVHGVTESDMTEAT